MNKYFMSLGIAAAATIFSAHAHVKVPSTFAQLEPAVIAGAQATKDQLSDEHMLVILNFFALETAGEHDALLKCAQFIEKNKDALEAIQCFAIGTSSVVQIYMEAMQKKIDRRTNLTEEQEVRLYQKLDDKITELFAYIRAICYSIFYGHIAKKDQKSLTFMFDENGIIPQEKRTRALPASV